jgi:hypothetical protein
MVLCLIIPLINEHIVHFYNKLYTEQCIWRPRVDELSFLSIDEEEITWLEQEFEEQEVWEVVRCLNGEKVPGPDGLKMDLMVVFSEFHSRQQFEKSFNATFVSLIPKKTEVVDVKDSS